jgi:hypothetical protein
MRIGRSVDGIAVSEFEVDIIEELIGGCRELVLAQVGA